MRRVEPLTDAHRAGLFALYERIFGAGKAARFRRRFDWQYSRNPYARDGQVTNWVLTSDSSVVGHVGIAPIDLRVGHERRHASWICDYMVDVSHRSGPEFFSLLARASESSELPMAYGMRDHVARAFVKLNWKRLTVGSFLIKFISLRAIAAIRDPPRAPGRAGHAGAQLRRAANLPRFCRQYLHSRLHQRPTMRAGAVAVRSEFDPSLDRLWEKVGEAYPVAVERNCDYLNWRYRVGGRDGARLIVLDGGGTPRGFALIEKALWRGIVVGLITELVVAAEQEDDARCLLAFVEDVLRTERVSAIMTEGFPARIRRVLLQDGFIEYSRDRETATFFDRFRTCPQPLIDDAENWLLTPGDSDRSLGYPRAAWREI